MNALMSIANIVPLRLSRKVAAVNPLIVNYHMVSDKELPYIKHLYHYRNIDAFRADLDFFKRHYYPLSMQEFLHSIQHKTKLPHHSVLFTFDDGFREMYEIAAPLLSDKKLTGTFFLTKNFVDNNELNYDNKKSLILDELNRLKQPAVNNAVSRILENNPDVSPEKAILNIPVSKRFLVDRILAELKMDIPAFLAHVKPYMTREQVKEMIQSGFTFGGHGVDHANYAELSAEEQVQQTIQSVDFVVNTFHLDYRIFAFPYSDNRIPAAFFHSISDKIDAAFGTQGLFDDQIAANHQRISLEKLPFLAEKTVKFYYLRRKAYQIMGKNTIMRN